MRTLLRLYAVTDRSWVGIQTLLEHIESSLLGGTTLVQLREKDLSDCEFIQEAISVKRLCERFGVPLLINDNVNVALRSGADGGIVFDDVEGQRNGPPGNILAQVESTPAMFRW